jgi:uncharacterized membrane protein
MPVEPPTDRRIFARAGVALGLGLGGLVDGIVLHQLLQWHHMVSAHDDYRYRPVSLRALEINTHWDGVFNASMVVITGVAIVLLWRARDRTAAYQSIEVLSGLVLIGWGFFQILDAVVNHYALGLHYVRQESTHLWAYEVAYVAFGVLLVIVGASISRSAWAPDRRASADQAPARS